MSLQVERMNEKPADEVICAAVGRRSPPLDLWCVDGPEQPPRHITLADYHGQWLALIFYPRDFSFVCPTELTAFSARTADFQNRHCAMLGISVDSLEIHQEWLAAPPDKGGLGPLQFPLASDPEGRLAQGFGVWVPEKMVCLRGLFIIDPTGVLQYSVIHNLNVGRSPDEVLRVLDALQTGGLCPANWTTADGVIDPEGALQPGKVLGHYRIRKQLGSGAFGAVFAAWDLRLERPVAIKVLKRSLVESREAVLTEARAAARLNHPNVCTIYAVEEEEGLPVIVMEHIEGRALTQVIRDGLDAPTALHLAAQIAAGLSVAHQNQVVHGDFKPANVIVSPNGSPKILDFGLSRFLKVQKSRDAEAELAQRTFAVQRLVDLGHAEEALLATVDHHSDSLRGTPAYMSPEQAQGSDPTLASDVFSFGLTLYEMLTGHAAYENRGIVQHLLRLPTADLACELAPKVAPPYRELLAALLAREPARRPSMDQVMRELELIG